MYIQRIIPKPPYGVIDKYVMSHKGISDGAKVLYAILFSFRPSVNYTDEYLCRVLNLSSRSITARKKELKDADLLITEQIGARIYHAYLGTTQIPASKAMITLKSKDRKE